MLVDGRIVAVKMSKRVENGDLEVFINEVVILSQVNHMNVVKLLGCCLETEVPRLVYEFIPNGTLHQHIHNPSEELPLTWEIRVRIVREVAGALAYLQSSSSALIYHRDIKSTNILLMQSQFKENQLFEIHDARVLEEGKKVDIARIAKLARRCLSLNGGRRPTMEEVAVELEGIQMLKKGSDVLQNENENESRVWNSIDFSDFEDFSSISESMFFDTISESMASLAIFMLPKALWPGSTLCRSTEAWDTTS